MSADQGCIEVFKMEFEGLQGYTENQIFNADEMGVTFKMLPNKSLASNAKVSALLDIN